MTVGELIDKLNKFFPETEVQAVVCDGVECKANTDEPIIEVKRDKKGCDWLIIRA